MKFKLFSLTQILLFLSLSIYFTAKLTFGSKGILEYYKLKELFQNHTTTIKFLKKEEGILQTKLSLLNETSVNLTYLEDLIRVNLNLGEEDEKLIILENET